MNSEVVYKELLNLFEEQKINDFQGSFDKHGGEFIKKNNKHFFTFGYSITEDYKVVNNDAKDFVVIHRFWLHTAFPELEKIVHPILSKNGLFGTEITYQEVYSSFSVETNFRNILPNEGVQIEKIEELEKIKESFMKFFHEDALPFFNHWHSLPVLNEYMQQDSSREFLSNLLGTLHQFKKAAILKLCNDPSYYEFMDSFYNKRKMIFEEYPEEKVAEQYYKASKELKEVLDNTEPIYNMSNS
ncbi:hypothetical protein [Aquimarina algiphila]|uniref:hypothetical protein n=1 Tax=Aquimarina algiphila TaxID=2047982 RepID=UPI002330E7B3|nr:hypothetical protein [Aquimarina algiphila]